MLLNPIAPAHAAVARSRVMGFFPPITDLPLHRTENNNPMPTPASRCGLVFGRWVLGALDRVGLMWCSAWGPAGVLWFVHFGLLRAASGSVLCRLSAVRFQFYGSAARGMACWGLQGRCRLRFGLSACALTPCCAPSTIPNTQNIFYTIN